VAIVLAIAVCLMLEKPSLADHAIKAKLPTQEP
jgi:hypothetical protein